MKRNSRSAPSLVPDTERPSDKVLAWDLPTRLFKWSLVLCVALAWATNRYADTRPYLHVWNGYTVLVLVVFRVLWGLVGGSTARFTAFVTSPWTALRFFIKQVRGLAPAYLGHSPAAGWVILVLMALAGVQATLGLFSADQDRLIIEGPLADIVSDAAIHRATALHRLGFNLILAAASVHIATNLLYALLQRKGLIKAMVTGRKLRGPYVDFAEAQAGSLPAAILCLAAAIAIVFGGIVALGGHPLQ